MVGVIQLCVVKHKMLGWCWRVYRGHELAHVL